MKTQISRLIVLLALVGGACDKPQSNPVLDVTGSKGPLGISVMNRERDALTDCAVTTLERGRPDEWVATVDRIEPMASERITWSRFMLSGHQMPSEIGMAAKHFTVSCKSHEPTRRGAGLAF